MKHLLTPLVASLLALSLTACGGGGSGGDGGSSDGSGNGSPGAPADTGPFSPAEYTGTWKPQAPVPCQASFPYNPAYHYQLRDVQIILEGALFRAIFSVLVFDDATCTVKRGLATDSVLITPVKTVLDGRDNVMKSDGGVWYSSSVGADGGMGIALTRVPDGSLSEIAGKKFLADVKDGKLFFSIAGAGVPLDGTGYPTQIAGTKFLVR